jgi:hypothetical protein
MPFQLVAVPSLATSSVSAFLAQLSVGNAMLVASPFITREGSRLLLPAAERLQLLTRATAANLRAGSLEREALDELLERGAAIRSIYNLHAKIYLADQRHGLVTSSNLTGPGIARNVELGLAFTDEPDLARKVARFFEALWHRAKIVSRENLVELAQVDAVLVKSSGIWRAPRAEEPLEPAPAIGEAVETIGDPEAILSVLEGTLGATAIAEEPALPPAVLTDEFGDLLLSRLPDPDALPRLLGGEPSEVQATLNRLVRGDAALLTIWLERYGSAATALLQPGRAFPYRRHVAALLIGAASPAKLAEIVGVLTSDPSNENQLPLAMPHLLARINMLAPEERGRFVDALLQVRDAIMPLAAPSRLDDKNFVRANLVRLAELAAKASPGREGDFRIAAALAPPPAPDAIPGVQEIKRARENLGTEFAARAEAWRAAVEAGAWHNSPQSVLTLFQQIARADPRLAAGPTWQRAQTVTVVHLRAAAVAERDHLLPAVGRLLNNSSLTTTQQVQLRAAIVDLGEGRHLPRSTGRLVGLSGALRAGPAAERWLEIKPALDRLSTLLMVLSRLERLDG